MAWLMRKVFPYYTGFLWAVSLMHLFQGFVMFLDHGTVNTTSIFGVVRHFGDQDIARYVLASLYIGFALFALHGITSGNGGWLFHVIRWLPQQFLVLAGALSSVEAILRGYYLDGTGAPGSGIEIARAHIFADQIPLVILAVGHFLFFFMWREAVHHADVVLHEHQAKVEQLKAELDVEP